MTRATSPSAIAAGSLVVFAGLCAALWWREHEVHSGSAERPLVVLAAPTSRIPLEQIAADYSREFGRRVELRFGPSEEILTQARFQAGSPEPADVFVPADDSYVRDARDLGLAGESFPVARLRGVLLLAPRNPKNIHGWNDLLRTDVRVGVPGEVAAVGKIAREHLKRTGRWAALALQVVDHGSVTAAANAAKLGGVDAAVVWDAVAAAPGYTGQTVLTIPELEGVTGRIEAAVLTTSSDPVAARRFARYVAADDRGLVRFHEAGFRVADGAPRWEDGGVP